VGKTSELKFLELVCRKAEETKKLDEGDLEKLTDVFGDRLTRALEAVEGRRVKKYVFNPRNRNVWIVVGKIRDYLIMPAADYCTCDDFYFRVMDNQIHLCYHLIAQKLATALESYDTIEENEQLYDTLMREWER
jgi:predicted nucleic acid-binding Zn finger protein